MICKWCKTEELDWKKVDGRWRLVYQKTGAPHLCRATRDKLAKKIKPPPGPPKTLEERLLIGFTKEGVKLILRDLNKPPEVVPEDMNDKWWNFIRGGENVIEEALP